MAKSLSILFVSSECYPFAKVGGLGDVSYSLPLAIRELGHDIRVMLPKYGSVSERKNRIHEINRLRDLPIPMGNETELATVKSSAIQNQKMKVQAYITTNQTYFDSVRGIYRDTKKWKEYSNNDERFAFFSKSVVETCHILEWFPDIIHVNNWQTALIPAFAREIYPKEFKKTKFLLTIHNIDEQCETEDFDFSMTNISEKSKENFMHKGKINFLKAGIHYADYVNTVSPSYAEQILDDAELTNGLNEYLKKKKKFKGILNGIDDFGWNPEKDKLIQTKLDSDFEAYKYDNKVSLLNKIGLEFHPKTPVIGMITRLDEQKGIPLLLEAADKILKENVQLVVLGKGDSKYRNKFQRLMKKYPEKLKVKFGIDNQLAHMIQAGADIFLMPSLSEPCGLNLMYSLIYGTVPVIRLTGGMKDVAEPYDPDKGEGNTITFENYDAKELLKSVKSALKLFEDEEKWMTIINNGRFEDFSWDESSKEYEEIYKTLNKS